MKKTSAVVLAPQPSSIAVVCLARGWVYADQLTSYRCSTGYKTQDLAVAAALKAGFAAVVVDGKIVARRPKA